MLKKSAARTSFMSRKLGTDSGTLNKGGWHKRMWGSRPVLKTWHQMAPGPGVGDPGYRQHGTCLRAQGSGRMD